MDRYVDNDRFTEVHEVVAEADGVAELLSEWGGDHREWQGEDRTMGATLARLREWSDPRPPRNSMLLWFGHGESNEDDALLAVRGAGTDGEDDSITPGQLGEYLVRNSRRRAFAEYWAVVVVEACGAARFVDQLLAYVLQRRAAVRLLLIGSGADQGSGYAASFREVLAEVLTEFSGNYHYIRLRDLAQRIQDLLSPGRVLYLLDGDEQLVRSSPSGRSVMMTLEDYARPRSEAQTVPEPDSAVVLGSVPSGLATAGGDAPTGELSWFFVGRTKERDRIAWWLASTGHGLLAVTGPPGCGKSALLGHLSSSVGPSAASSGADGASRHEPWADDVPRPQLDTFLNLTGASVRQIVSQLARVFGVPAPSGISGDDERIRTLLDAVRSKGARTRTLFADGLDASADPSDSLTCCGCWARNPAYTWWSAPGRPPRTASTYRVPRQRTCWTRWVVPRWTRCVCTPTRRTSPFTCVRSCVPNGPCSRA
ncbi:ATP-binding protein [Streptomyces sp. Tue 6430]|nr:ATP-binding protein [Streptomyces sp. Tue 6430]